MTTAQFEVFNSNGSLQFDINNVGLHMIQKGTMYTNYQTSAGGHPRPFLPSTTFTANAPIMAWGKYASGVSFNGFVQYNSTSNNWGLGGVNKPSLTFPDPTQMNYYIFDNGASVPFTGAAGTNAGLELFDSSGALTYSSISKPLRVIGVVQGTTSSVVGTYTYPSGRTYAATITVQPSLAYPGNSAYTLGVYVEVTDTGFVVSTNSFSNPGIGFTTSDYAQILFLDVTNY